MTTTNAKIAQAEAGPSSSKTTSGGNGGARETNIAGVRKTPRWSDKVAARNKMASIKEREKAMRDAKLAEAQRKKDVTLERKRKKQERERLDEMAKKVSHRCPCLMFYWILTGSSPFQMSAKKLERKKRRMGLTKKVSH